MTRPDGPIAVTGATGYLGGRVAAGLGDGARALVRSAVPWLPGSTQFECDLLGPADVLARALDGSVAVVHLAGHNEVVAATEPDRARTETETMAEAVLRAAARVGVRRVVYVSTVHVYGTRLVPGATIDEDVPPAPTSPYARARLECETILASDPAVELVVLRLTNAVGAPADPSVDRWTLVASDLCRSAVLDRTMVLRSSGQQGRDFITLDDACRLVLGSTDRSGVPPGTYNLAAGRSSTVLSLAQLIRDRVEQACGWRPGLEAPPATGPPEEPYTVRADLLADHGLRAELPLEEGVDEIIDHCIKHEASLRQGRPGR